MGRLFGIALWIALAAGCSLESSAVPGDADAIGRDTSTVTDSAVADSADTAVTDTRPRDGTVGDSMTVDGSMDASMESFRDVTWGDPERIVGADDPSRCETDPVTTTDLRWLFVSRNTGPTCLEQRRFYLFEWNDGSPVSRGIVPSFDSSAVETNPHVLDGAWVSRPDSLIFFHSASGPSTASSDLRWVEMVGDPPTPTGSQAPVSSINGAAGENMPSLTTEGRVMVFSRDGELWQALGIPPDGFVTVEPITVANTADREIDPAISPDGRVLVFERILPGNDGELFVSRRDEITESFDTPMRLPRSSGGINTSRTEADPHITSRGDLLFSSDRGDGEFRVYIARRL